MSADIVRCKEFLSIGNGFRRCPCHHPAIRDGFCGHHHPDRAEARKRGQQTVIDRKAAAVARELEIIRERERKIAAFPELLAALEIASGHLDQMNHMPEVSILQPGLRITLEQARAAIKLAKGE